MTSSRVVRGTKGRILLCICAILIITGIIACYNNTLSQLDDVRRTNQQCHQQQENLSTQLQVIFDYKQRLEKSLKTEKADHQQSKKDLETRIDEEKSRHEKATNEANVKFSSLQQHYNLLQTQHDDFKEECSKIQQQQLNEINDLQSKFKEVQGQLKQTIVEKENSLEHLKTRYLQLQVEKENLEKQIKGTQSSHLQSEYEVNHLTKVNHELQRELEELKIKCSVLPKEETILEPQKQPPEISPTKYSPHVTTNFSKQVDVGNSVYQIRDSRNNPLDAKQDPSNVADLPSNADEPVQSALAQVDAPKTEKQINYNEQINNNNNNNNNDHVLAAPNNNDQIINQKSSSTMKSSSKASLDAAQPLNLPTVTPSSLKNKPSQESRVLNQDPHVLPLPYAHKKILPVGVVPVPDTPLETVEESKGGKTGDEKDIRDDVNNAFPNRYRSNLIINELANEDKAIEADKQQQKEQINEVGKDGKQNILKSDVGDKENNALEVFDPPLNEKDKVLDSDPFGIDDAHINNNNNNIDKINVKHPLPKPHKQQHINALPAADGGVKLNEGHKIYDAQDGGDYDKDVQLEENDPEAEDDDPDYADHIARQKDPAVRN